MACGHRIQIGRLWLDCEVDGDHDEHEMRGTAMPGIGPVERPEGVAFVTVTWRVTE